MKKRKFSTVDPVKVWLKRFGIVLIAVVVLLIGRALWRIDFVGSSPQITVKSKKEGKILGPAKENYLGKTVDFEVLVKNKKDRICTIEAKLKQGTKEAILGDYRVKKPKEDLSEAEKKEGIPLAMTQSDLPGLGFSEGPAVLSLFAKDCSVFGRKSSAELKLSLDFYPPTVQITSTQHYVNQGGAQLVTYKVPSDTVWSGVKVAPYEFKGFPKPGADEKSGEHFALFVYSYDLPADTKIEVVARDKAGNQSVSLLKPAKFFPKTFRKRELPIDEQFIQTKIADILSNTPSLKSTGDPLKDFLLVNRDLRKKNAGFLVELSGKSEPKFYWKDAFKPLSNAAVEGSFADYRSYFFKGEKIDEQVHLGFDLAGTEKNPIYAAGAGKVLFAEYLGIYGNVVVLDHGYGLTTLYGHLSSIDVKPGEFVKKGQKIASSGATGLAAGDHLHFSMLIQGVQTNPVEFWDQHWIKDNIYLRMDPKEFGKTD